jgi:formylmethanofuran dehydrogenase subunit E
MDPEAKRAMQRRSYNREKNKPGYRARKVRNQKAYEARHRGKTRARWVAQKRIKITGMCESCGERPAEQRHHADYSLPLEVELLCRECHQRKDAELITIEIEVESE